MAVQKVYKLRNVVVLLVLSCRLLVGARQCLGRDQCSCVFDDDQGLIALHSLANTDLTPRFQDISSDDGNTYSYNPCYPFSEGDCGQAAQLTLTSVCACANGCNETGPIHCISAGSKRSSIGIWSLGAITFITCITRIF